MMKKTLIADGGLLAVAFVWGVTFVLVQNAISLLEPFSFNAVRFSIAALFLFIWLVSFHGQQLKKLDKKILMAGVTLGIWLFSAYALQTFGLLYTSSSKSGFITGLSVVLVPLFAYFLLKDTPKQTAVIGAVIATIGLYLLTVGDNLAMNLGDVLTFFCAIAFAIHITLTGKYAANFPALSLTVIQITVVGFLNWAFAFAFEHWQVAFSVSTLGQMDVWLALFITSIFATALAFLAQTSFQKYTTPTRVALIFAMEPVFAALTAFVIIHERLGFKALLGCLFILIGMILSELPQKFPLKLKALLLKR